MGTRTPVACWPLTDDGPPLRVSSAEFLGDIMATPVQMRGGRLPVTASQNATGAFAPSFLLSLVPLWLVVSCRLLSLLVLATVSPLPEVGCPSPLHPPHLPARIPVPLVPVACQAPSPVPLSPLSSPAPGGASGSHGVPSAPRPTALWGEVVGCIVWGSALLWDNYTIYCLS